MKQLGMIIAAAMLSLFAVSCAPSAVIVAERPAPPVIVRPAPPRPDYVWVEGEWIVRGGRYTWQNGYWVRPRYGRVWESGHWERTRGGWYWQRGHWR